MKRLLALASLVWLCGCSDSDHPDPIDVWYPLPECPRFDLATCDTREPDCQQRLLSLAGCMYGVDDVPDVPIHVVSEDELVEQLDSLSDAETSEEDEAALPYAEQALVQLSLAQPGDFTGEDSTANFLDRVDGVYIDAERGISIIDRGEPKNDDEANALLVHELIHALQDAEYDLGDWRSGLPSTEDATLALRSVTEGQATYLQFRALLAMSGTDVSYFDWSAALTDFQGDVLGDAYEDPSPYMASVVTFPYAYGVQLAYDGWKDRGLGFHAKQFADPWLTTYDVIRTIDDAGDSIAEVTFNEPEGLDPAELELMQDTALGAFLTELHLRATGVAATSAVKLSSAWRGDRLFVYKQGESAAWLWELEFASDAYAAQFVERDFGDLVAESDGTRAFIAGADGAPAEALLTAGRAFLSPQ